MSRTIALHRGLFDLRGAVLENERIVEWLMDQTQSETEPGMLVIGQVEAIHDGMEAAFVDIGSGKRAYLNKTELKSWHHREEGQEPAISSLVTKGAYLLLEITRAGTDTKGPKVTEMISFPGKYSVYLPFSSYIAVSKKMSSNRTRETWREWGKKAVSEPEGMIIRTHAEGEAKETIAEEIKLLQEKYQEVETAFHQGGGKAGTVLFDPSRLLARVARDYLTAEDTQVLTDHHDDYRWLKRERQVIQEGAAVNFSKRSLSEVFGFDQAMHQTLRPYVWLPNGGSILIEATEAMTVVDVNSGRYTGKENLRQTAYITNLAAAKVIARELRLRDVSGIVLIDFIDMEEDQHREDVVKTLKEACKKDRTMVQVAGFTSLGLVEMTRKKTRASLQERLLDTCGICQGKGDVPGEAERLYQCGEALMKAGLDGTEAIWLEVNPSLLEEINHRFGDVHEAVTGGLTAAVYVTSDAGEPAFSIRMTAENEDAVKERIERQEKPWIRL
ncbi:Rne/Rng family ribonuclease [Salisediminibacterium beveridgei]|nr:Rne/Rng family ribonuclease [Salisediminibacterium beveridgei]